MHSSNWLVWQIVDSAFPTGGFAHSWGLETAWHGGEVTTAEALREFLREILWQAGHGSLPLVTAAHRAPERFEELDVLCHAFLTNAVVNRASRTQGRAFLSTCARIWPGDAMRGLEARTVHTHHAPLFGAVLEVLGIEMFTAQRMFLYGIARGVLSAAVRLGIVGPYAAQRLLHECAADLDRVLNRCGGLDDEHLAQTAPIIDILQASHDRLYSRLFQS